MAHARWWDFAGPLLPPTLEAHALDRRGHGDSDWSDEGHYGWSRDLADAEAVMDQVDPRPWVLIGHSQGGLQAVLLAIRRPSRIAAVILIDIPLDPKSPRWRQTGAGLRRIPQLRHASLRAAVKRFQPFPRPHRIDASALDHIARHSFKPTSDGGFTSKFHWEIYHRSPDEEPDHLLDFAVKMQAISVPTLSLRGGHSTILLADEHPAQVAMLRHGQGHVVAHATHNLHVEQPEAVSRAIIDFVAELPAFGAAGASAEDAGPCSTAG